MKKLILIAISLVMMPILSMAQDDDLYFTPVKKKKQEEKKEEVVVKNTPRKTFVVETESPAVEVYTKSSRDEDEYNRRYSNGDSYPDSSENEEAEEADGGRDYGSSEDDYYYSRRILRFRSPRVGIAVSSPLYWDLVYCYGAYDYLYDDYFAYDPFFWGYGWRYGWSWGPWSCWYGPIWGWHSPHHWHYWGCGPMWGGGIHHGTAPGFTRYNRGTFSNRYGSSDRIRTSALANNGSRSFSVRNPSGIRTSAAGRGSFTLGDRNGSSGTSAIRGNAGQNRVGGQVRGTRSRGTTSSYSRSGTNKSSNYNRVSSSRSSANTGNTDRGNSSRTSERTSVRSNSTPSRGGSSSFQSSGSRGGFGGGGSFGGGSRGGSGGGRR